MVVNIVKEKWTGRVNELILGTGSNLVKVGGETSLPFLDFEGEIPNRPVIAMEVWDMEPVDWPGLVKKPFAGVLADPVAWARKNMEYGADLIALRLLSANPDYENTSSEQCAATAKAVAEAVDLPLVILGCDSEEKDADLLPVVGEVLSGKNFLMGPATENNYKTITAACLVQGHSIIAASPLDINLAKQLNILITEMNLGADRIVIDPLIGALGYGLEYSYSIMERARLGALKGDKMLSMPVICNVGQEAWETKEAKLEEQAEWGEQGKRALLWEIVTSAALAQAGGSIFVLRHPESLRQLKIHIEKLMTNTQY